MLLILMRHGIAEDGEPDEARRLTREGAKKTALVARALGAFGARPDIVVSSPRVRAIETAQVVIEELEIKRTIEQAEVLDFTSDWAGFSDFINERMTHEHAKTVILATGHQPTHGQWLSMALTGTSEDFDMKKAAAAGIRFDGPVAAHSGTLEFYVTPGAAAEVLKKK